MENNISNNMPFNSEKQNGEQNRKQNGEQNTNHNIYCVFDSDNESDNKFDNEYDVNLNIESNDKSDSDEYVDLSSNIESKSEDVYQFIIENNKLELRHIGKFTMAPDIIIKQNFGPKSNMSLFSCVYTYNELTTQSDELFFPLVKLVIKNELNVITTCIAIKLIDYVQVDKPINEWDLYWLENKSNLEHIKMCKIEKNINPTNIIEKIIGYSVNN